MDYMKRTNTRVENGGDGKGWTIGRTHHHACPPQWRAQVRMALACNGATPEKTLLFQNKRRADKDAYHNRNSGGQYGWSVLPFD